MAKVLLLLAVVLGLLLQRSIGRSLREDDVVVGSILKSGESSGTPGAVDQDGNPVRDTSSCFAVGECERCTKEAQSWSTGEWACRATGFKQMNQCKVETLEKDCETEGCGVNPESSATKIKEVRAYLSCAPIDAGPDRVMWFESMMVFGAAGSLYVVWQRKKQAYQRLSNIVNN